MTEVLVVDDSDATRKLIRSMLDPERYGVLEAADGRQALDALRANPQPLVVLLDYYMPNMDGGAVLKVVADEDGALAKHEYIVISSSVGTFPLDFIDLLRHLSIRILPKPFDQPVLAAAVAQAAERLNAPPEEPLPAVPDA